MLLKQGKIIQTAPGCVPLIKRYLDESKGVQLQDVWDDISPLRGRSRILYPTQKPEKLLERIINASSRPGDLFLDPMCGSGTSVSVAKKLKRNWIGIDISGRACEITRRRLHSI